MFYARIIRNDQQYKEQCDILSGLLKKTHRTQEEEELIDLLTLLIDMYTRASDTVEEKALMFYADAVDAIKFRMKQGGYTRKDLIRLIGSPSKASEVMNRKVRLSLQMIRALHEGMGIPAEILLREPDEKRLVSRYNTKDYPFSEMLRRGYFNFDGALAKAKAIGSVLLEDFFAVLPSVHPKTCFRKTLSQIDESDMNAVNAWQCRIIHRVHNDIVKEYIPSKVNTDVYNEIAKLSIQEKGEILVKSELNNLGIHVIYEPQLPKTKIDGAAFLADDGHPVIAMTLRHDRLDNFWFTVMHELYHVIHHLEKNSTTVFMDNIDSVAARTDDADELAADNAAEEALIPSHVWKDKRIQALLHTRSASVVKMVAHEMNVSPAVLAGRIRWEKKNYKYFSGLLTKCRNSLISAANENFSYDNK